VADDRKLSRPSGRLAGGGSPSIVKGVDAIVAFVTDDLTEPEFLALAYLTAINLEAERSVVRRAELEGLVNRLVSFDAARLSKADRAELGYAAKT
jgi:hypothetical protein